MCRYHSLRLGLLLASLLALPVFSHAGTLTVTSTGDDAADPATLRGAIAAAADGDTIAFDEALAGQAVLLDASLGPLAVTKNVEIVGPLSGRVALDMQNAACPILQSFDPAMSVTLRNLEFRNMKNTSGAYQQPQQSDPKTGPAVSITGSATIEDCDFHDLWMSQTEGNGSDTKSDGGSALRVAGNLSMARCEFRNNNLSASTGGIGSVVVGGATVSIADCSFVGNGASAAPKGGTLAVLGSTTDFTLDHCLFATNAAQYGQGGIMFRQDISSGTFRIRNSIFRAFSGNRGWKNGGAIGYDGGGAVRFVFENDEFSDIYFGGWGGAVRLENSSGAAAFANCTFVNCAGNEWGGTVDTRCQTLYVNCTFVGNVNAHSNNNGSGTAFAISDVSLLNTVCTWNYSNGGSVWNDTSRYGGTLRVLNSYNHAAGTAPNVTDNAMDYTADTIFFAEPFRAVSKIQSYTVSTPISSPVLSYNANDPDGVPGVVEISPYGVLADAGWPVKHDADWENVAYSKDGGATWTALVGSETAATILLAADSRGLAYNLNPSDTPVPPIGSAQLVAGEEAPVEVLAFSVDAETVTWTDATALLALHFAEGVPSAVVTAYVAQDGGEPVEWTNFVVSASVSATSVFLTGLLPDTAYEASVSVLAYGEIEPVSIPSVAFSTKGIGAPTVTGIGVNTATATAVFSIPATSPWTSARAVFVPEDGSQEMVVDASALDELVFTGALLADKDYHVRIEVVREGWVASSPATFFQTPYEGRLSTALFFKRAVFTVSGYDGDSALTNFPVLVRLSSAAMPGFNPTEIAPGGLRFSDANGLLLAHEVDTWANEADGECAVWVSLPLIEGRTTKFTMYCCKPSQSAFVTPARDSSRTWLLAGYIGVWHFGEPSTNAAGLAAYADSTGHGLDASPTRADNTPIFRPGATNVVGSAIQCRGGLFLPDEALAAWAAPHAAAVSIEAWVHGNGALSNDQKILSSYSSWDHGIALRLNDRYWYGAGNIRQWPSDYAIGNDAWKHLAAAWSATDNIGYVRVDGALALSGLHGAEDLGFAQYSLTSNGGNGEVFRGLADEFRVRRGVSSADWTQAVYDTSRPGTDFLTYGEMHQLLGLTIMVR